MKKSISYLICVCLFFLLLYVSFISFTTGSLRECSSSQQNTISAYISPQNAKVENTSGVIQKKVFLTFDDGPSITNTREIINILKKNNVKATFFVVGKKVEAYPNIIKEMSDSGMSICVHTYSHEYDKIYASIDSCLEDIDRCSLAIKEITGKQVKPYVRLPGGSDNLVSGKDQMKKIRNKLLEKHIRYVDWNVSSADAVSHIVPTVRIKNNVISQCKNKTIAVVLMHDAYYKKTTVEALSDIINNLKEEGFIFKTFDEITPQEEAALIRIKVINRGASN
jgi:peptidoglycan-N-acetylglucosamine deacetylase